MLLHFEEYALQNSNYGKTLSHYAKLPQFLHDMSAEEICEALVAQFPTMSFDGITGTGMTWGSNGEVSKLPMAVVIQDGVYVSA